MNERTKQLRARLGEIERELAQLKKKKQVMERESPGDAPDEFPEPHRQPPSGASEPKRVPAGREASPVATGEGADDRRERFASYFMTGSLGRGAPQLRKERRAMRNKAILMAVVALFLLIVLVYYLTKS